MMPSLHDAIRLLSERQEGQRSEPWIAAVSVLVFSEMRLDPAHLSWQGGDVLLYSSRFAPLVQDALALAGGDAKTILPSSVKRCGEVLQAISSSRRLFCLVDAKEASLLDSVTADINPRLCVFSPASPSSPTRWSLRTFSNGAPETLSAMLREWDREGGLPLWIILPDSECPSPSEAADSPALPSLAERMSCLGTETAFSVLAQVNALRAEGRDIISFGLGEPDFNTPAHIKEAAKRALDENHTHYGPSSGNPDLRAAIARYIQRTRHIPVSPDEVVVTPGAKPILFDAIMSLINPGDEVIYPNPGYPIYESVIDWVGAKSVPIPLREESQWNFDVHDLRDRITSKTRMIVLNTPGNPTGTLLGLDALRAIADLALRHNLWVLTDEVYSQIVFGVEFHSVASFPGMKERTILVDGFSKTYAMTGWRLGYGVMNRDLARQVANIETNIDSCTCAFSQVAAISALEGPQDESEAMVRQFQERGRVITELLNHIDGVHCVPPQGAFYVFPNVTGACRKQGFQTANELQHALLHEAGVAVLPRTCFGRRLEGEDQEYIRLSYAASLEQIREGLRRMKEFIER